MSCSVYIWVLLFNYLPLIHHFYFEVAVIVFFYNIALAIRKTNFRLTETLAVKEVSPLSWRQPRIQFCFCTA